MPDGSVRSGGIAASGRLTCGAGWSDAVRTFDNGMFSGKGLAIFLDLYDSSAADPDESVLNAFAGTFEGLAADIRDRTDFLRKKGFVLSAAMLTFTAYSLFFTPEISSDRLYAVILIIGAVLAATTVLFRNVCVNGRLV